MTLFMFIVTANFLGLIPTSFTTTSHFAVTAILALAVFLTVTIVGFVKNGAGFLGLFWVSSRYHVSPDPGCYRTYLIFRTSS